MRRGRGSQGAPCGPSGRLAPVLRKRKSPKGTEKDDQEDGRDLPRFHSCFHPEGPGTEPGWWHISVNTG